MRLPREGVPITVGGHLLYGWDGQATCFGRLLAVEKTRYGRAEALIRVTRGVKREGMGYLTGPTFHLVDLDQLGYDEGG